MKDKKALILPFIIFLCFVLIFYYAKKTFFTLILSIAFSYLLNPVIRFFEVRGIKRVYIVSMIYLTIGILFLSLIIIISNLASIDITLFINNWPDYYARFESIFTSIVKKMIKVFPFLSQLKLDEKILGFLVLIPSYVISFLPSLMFVFIIPFISFFILIKGDEILDFISNNIPSRYVETLYHIISRIDFSLGSYIRGVLTDAFVIFLISFFGLFIMGINYFSIIAVIVGISAIIPYLGAFVGAFVSSIMAYLQYNEIYAVVKVIIFFVGIRFFDDWFLQPYIMNKNINLNPAVVVLSIMAGGEIAGIWGVIFAVPLVCILRELISIAFELQKSKLWERTEPEIVKINIPYT